MGSAKRDKTVPKRKKNRANKINLVFDENKRKEFLTGFHKRKLQRKKQAKDQFEKDIKEERKRIKAEAKESYKKLVVSHRPIPELEKLLAEEYEDDDVTVKVIELSTNEIAKRNNLLGANQPKQESESEEEEENPGETNEIPGMELKRKLIKKEKVQQQKFNSEKDIKKLLKKQATKTVQKSKVFQLKNKMESKKQKKKSMHQKKVRMKVRDTIAKKKGYKTRQ